jgi:protein-tyrosine phosphatase
MAAALLNRLVTDRGEAEQWQIESAGTWAIPDLPATSSARLVSRACGIDLTSHRARPLTGDMLHAADLILVMTRFHLEALRAEFPEVAGKTYLISQLIGQMFDIDDPVNGTLDDYQACLNDLSRILTQGFARLKELAQREDPISSNEAVD